jgi:hypothetical protein
MQASGDMRRAMILFCGLAVALLYGGCAPTYAGPIYAQPEPVYGPPFYGRAGGWYAGGYGDGRARHEEHEAREHEEHEEHEHGRGPGHFGHPEHRD